MFCPTPPPFPLTHLHTKLMFYCISITETRKILKFVVCCRNMFREISQNIKENLKFSNFREIEDNISFFVPKIVHMAISIKILSNFPLKLQNTTSFLDSLLFQFFSETTLSKICSFKSLSKFRVEN